MTLYDEIFVENKYLSHGLRLVDDAQVIDVGANIGLFALYALQKAQRVNVLALEPVPQIAEVLKWNLRNSTSCQILQIGVSDCELAADFTYYPRSPCMSGLYADSEYDAQLLTQTLINSRPEMAHLFKHSVDRNLLGEPVRCKLKPLSTIIDECNIQSIDLLKIDIEKSELAALKGIEERHWPKIEQLVIEIHDLQQNRLIEITAHLQRLGFYVTIEQDKLFQGTDVYMLYAKRS